jgi:hypothetical protein
MTLQHTHNAVQTERLRRALVTNGQSAFLRGYEVRILRLIGMLLLWLLVLLLSWLAWRGVRRPRATLEPSIFGEFVVTKADANRTDCS